MKLCHVNHQHFKCHRLCDCLHNVLGMPKFPEMGTRLRLAEGRLRGPRCSPRRASCPWQRVLRGTPARTVASYILTYTHVVTCTHACTLICTQTRAFSHTHPTHAHTHSCTQMGAFSHTHVTHAHIHTCTQMQAFSHTHPTHARTHTHAQRRGHSHTHTQHVHAHTHLCTQTGALSHTHPTHAHTLTCMHTHAHRREHSHTHAHTQTHAHSYAQTQAFSYSQHIHAHSHTHSCPHTYTHTHAHMHTLAYTHMVNHTHTCARMRTDMSILSHTCTHIHAHTHTLSHHHTYYMNISPGPDAALEPSKMSPPHHHPPAPGSWVRCTFPPLSQLPVGLNCVLSKGRKTEPPPGSWVPPPGFFEPCLSAQPQPEGDPGAEPAYQPAAAAQTTERGSRQTALRTCASAKGRTA